MAIDLTTQYPGKVGTASPSWPFGEPRNITTPGDGTGTPWEAAIVKDTEALKQSLLTAGGIVPSGTPDTVAVNQNMQALVEQAMGRPVRCAVAGTATAYVLTPAANQYGAASLFDGLTVEWESLGGNTGPMTINYNGLGVTAVVDPEGNALKTGQITTSNGAKYLRATYDSSAAAWILHLNRVLEGTGPLILSDAINIAGGVVGPGGAIPWTSITNANLQNAQAVMAILELRTLVTGSGTPTGITARLWAAAGGVGPSLVNIQRATDCTTTPGVASNADTTVVTVNLDALFQFDYQLQIIGTAFSTLTWDINLLGWYGKYGQRDF